VTTEAEPRPGTAERERTDADTDGHEASVPPVTDGAEDAEERALDDPRSARRRRLVWSALGAAVIAVGVGAWLWAGNGSSESSSVAAGPVATTVVERGRISATRSWDGTLEQAQLATVTSRVQGTITRLGEPGVMVERGAELYRVDERPVALLYGQVPMFRELGPGASGTDVEQLEANLAKLGYDGFTADRTYDASTAEAVRAWQADLGAPQTGNVGRGDVVFVPEAGRVGARRVQVGDVVAPGTPVLDITGGDQVVSLEVPVDDRDQLEPGSTVTVRLASGRDLAGTVSETTLVAASPEGPGGAGEGGTAARDRESTVQVDVTLDEAAPEDAVGTSVEVVVATNERSDVLLVPVNALLALAEGGFGLEVVRNDGTSEIVAVDTGLFANGEVEVSGDGIAEGTVVGTAGR
jgi:peptidoglycan hydrolase-like protein with peptidoglycan-binding domain